MNNCNISLTLGALVTLALGNTTANAADAPCDRVCLVKIADQYLTALVNHKPAEAPLATTVVFNENGSPTALGAGSWQAAKGVRPQRQYVADIQTGQIGVMAVLDGANDEFQELALRLKVAGGKITEVESLWTQDGQAGPAWSPETMLYREAPFVRTVPAKNYTARDNLKKVVEQYWDVATSTHNGFSLPYASDCARFENGTNVGWEQELDDNQQQRIKEDPVKNAFIADPETGIYWGCARETTLSTAIWNSATNRNYVIDDERGLVMSFVKVDSGGTTGPVGPAAEAGMGAAPQAAPQKESNPLRPVQIGTIITGSRSTGGGGPAGMSTKTAHASLRNATIYQAQTNWIVGGKIKREVVFYHITPKAK
jgi:hypothetical protein